jgi:hypothetical protein
MTPEPASPLEVIFGIIVAIPIVILLIIPVASFALTAAVTAYALMFGVCAYMVLYIIGIPIAIFGWFKRVLTQ